ncbi:MAG: tetratricopeptide repeat protein [Rubritalea sp.]|uniref:tetratricopeptide repeat protein n=1 Tax=Rubritalea sp. TaxID=2109375 RepID=UPI003241BDF4
MRLLTLIFTLLGICFAQAQQEASIITQISSTNLIEGEVGYFSLIYRGVNPKQAPPESIDIGGMKLTQRGFQQQYINGDRYFIYQYPISDAKAGNYSIPALDLELQGTTVKSQPANFQVVPVEDLKLEQFKYKENTISCYSKVFIGKTTLYPGESTIVEYKIYIPANLNPQGWGLPKPDKIFNCTAWRFSPPTSNRDVGQAFINNKRYVVGSYTTVLSSIKAGDASFGPLTTELIIAPSNTTSRFGFSRRQTAEMPITSEDLRFEVLPFPSTAPPEFKGAVGEFTIEADLPVTESISLNDSITATVTIAGSGNLPDIIAPELEDSATWKVVDVSRVQQGDERKELSGQTQFTYILQPLRGADTLPRFTFAHFDPVAEEFVLSTTSTSAITVTVPEVTGSAVLPATAVPTESMQDILGPLTDVNLTRPARSVIAQLPVWTWQVVPALFLVAMLGIAGQRKVRASKQTNSTKSLQLNELKKLNSFKDQDFLKEAGGYVERWLADSQEAQSVLDQRDSQCYQPAADQKLDSKQRSSILQLLKSLSVLTLIALLTFSQQSWADESSFKAWEAGDYQTALDGYLEASEKNPGSADLLFNVGDCYYRANQPGMAALFYKKALAIDPFHYEASKNLTFTQKTQGSILGPEYSELEKWILELPATAYQQAIFLGIWVLALTLIALKLFHLKNGKFALALTLIILSPFWIILSSAAWLKHPQRMASTTGKAGMVTEFTSILTEPVDVSGKELDKKTMIKANPASPCRIIAERGAWTYIELANGTRGWTPSERVSEI